MKFKRGDRIKFIKMYKEYGIVKASKSSTGVIQGFSADGILIKLTKNGKLLSIPASEIHNICKGF